VVLAYIIVVINLKMECVAESTVNDSLRLVGSPNFSTVLFQGIEETPSLTAYALRSKRASMQRVAETEVTEKVTFERLVPF
jgi:hypothetical protein